MADIRDDRKYHEGHGWVVVDGNDTAWFGITDFAQEELNDVLMVVLPKVGDKVTQGVPMGEIESLKVISDLVAPATGEVIEINEAVKKNPALVNNEPYDGGWLVKVKLSEPSQVASLLDSAAYAATTAA
ncbi:MAG: glycine cleavage system protein GcvH [Chloroflexi bacterium]|nr:glycine cleavage system protein GcvH [Chloroflexota bacterium]